MKYSQPIGAEENAQYQNAGPSIGVACNSIPAAAVEYPQREIINVITKAGLTPKADSQTQLDEAIRLLVRSSGNPDEVPVVGLQKADMLNYGTYNQRQVITATGTFTAPVSGWYRLLLIGGGGGGGKGGRGIVNAGLGGTGGKQGGTTRFKTHSAQGGSGGGGGGGYHGCASGGGGGGRGYTTEAFEYLEKDEKIPVTIGAGGLGAKTVANITDGLHGAGPKGGKGSIQYQGGGGGEGAMSGAPGLANYSGDGGNGATGTWGYGGGGGGGNGVDYGDELQWPGYGYDGGKDGIRGTVNVESGHGGNGGNGAIIVYYQREAV